MCVRERDRSMYQLEPVDLYVTHGEVRVPRRGPCQLWPLLLHNRVGEHQRQLLLLLWISTQAQEDKEGLEQNPVSKYVLYNIAPRSCPCMCFWALYCKVRTLRLDFAWEAAIAVDRSGGGSSGKNDTPIFMR